MLKQLRVVPFSFVSVNNERQSSDQLCDDRQQLMSLASVMHLRRGFCLPGPVMTRVWCGTLCTPTLSADWVLPFSPSVEQTPRRRAEDVLCMMTGVDKGRDVPCVWVHFNFWDRSWTRTDVDAAAWMRNRQVTTACSQSNTHLVAPTHTHSHSHMFVIGHRNADESCPRKRSSGPFVGMESLRFDISWKKAVCRGLRADADAPQGRSQQDVADQN